MIIADSDSKIFLKGMSLKIRKGVFNPEPNITNSTLMILNNLPNVKNKDILDMGCGSGVIGIYCVLKGAKKVICADIDEKSIKNSKENIINNKVKNIVRVKKSDLFDNIKGTFDYIFGNLPINDESWNLKISTTELMKKFLSECPRHIRKGGNVYFTWNSTNNFKPVRDFLVKEGYKFKEKIEKKPERQWYLFEVKF
jgi:release factor glutamine methyltransferase